MRPLLQATVCRSADLGRDCHGVPARPGGRSYGARCRSAALRRDRCRATGYSVGAPPSGAIAAKTHRGHEAAPTGYGDDNPDIEDYLGYFEFQGVYNRNNQNFGLFFRNTLKEGYRGAVQLDWGFPVYDQLRGYVQYFYGYGESLIDYNHKVNKLGIGIKLTDWL
jgi:hypothetical protein